MSKNPVITSGKGEKKGEVNICPMLSDKFKYHQNQI